MTSEHQLGPEPQRKVDIDDGLAPSHIVGIGASAGGLEAIEGFFGAMASDSGAAFVVIQHLSPNHKSLMVELLSKRTRMAVHRSENNVRVERDTVYLIPPNKNLRIFHGRLVVAERERDARGMNLPIDVFFRSLADDQGAKAVAIVLSGTGSDGTSGIRAIKDALGMVMVQSEKSAAFDGMPRSALATGMADFVLPPAEMPALLVRYFAHPYATKMEQPTLEGVEGELNRLFALLREVGAIDFTHYKASTVVRRIERRMAVNQLQNLEEYVSYLERNPGERMNLQRELLIGVTNFFRDPEAFNWISETGLPSLAQGATNNRLRIWVAGCSTGEEAYSMAILCVEVMQRLGIHLEVKIFATDVDREAILQAGAGVFSASAVADVPAALLAKHFTPKDEGFQIARRIREMVVFAQHNLVKDPPFTNIDLISCRNLLIYLQPVLQTQILEVFNFSLKPEGILFLGSSETTGEVTDCFEPLDRKWRLYRSRGRRKAERGRGMAGMQPHRLRDRVAGAVQGGGARAQEEERLLQRLTMGMADYLPFTMVVSENFELVHLIGDASRFMRFPTGKMVTDVTKLVDSNLAIPLSTGLRRVFARKEEQNYANICVGERQAHEVVNLRIKPLPGRRGNVDLAAVFIEEAREATQKVAPNATQYDVGREAEHRIQDLENELQFTRENLQATVEELESSNEELQATNEELLASNEELQSTNEELQSVNEELYTVNAELEGKITELTEVNNDLDNVLQNTGSATVFVDENLDIRRFTPAASEIFRIMDNDIGRPLGHLAHNLHGVDVAQLAADVQADGRPTQFDVETMEGLHYLLRLFPYQIAPQVYSGVVLTLVNISSVRKLETDLSRREARMATLVNVIPDGYVLIDGTGRIEEVNPAVCQLLGYSAEELIGHNVSKLMPADVAKAHDGYIGNYLRTGEAHIIGRGRRVDARCKNGALLPLGLSVADMELEGRHWFVGLLRPLID